MLPFIIADNSETINLAQVCRIVSHTNKTVSVYFADGECKNYYGDAAKILKIVSNINLQLFDNYLKQITEQSRIIAPPTH